MPIDDLFVMFDPTPVAPQIPPDSHDFQSGPTVYGPWHTVPAVVTPSAPRVWCDRLHPQTPLGEGVCSVVVTTVGPTDTHTRASAYAMVNGVKVSGGWSNLHAVPETNPGALFFLFVFLALAVAVDDPRGPKGPKRRT